MSWFDSTQAQPHFVQWSFCRNGHAWQIANRSSISSWVRRGIPARVHRANAAAKFQPRMTSEGNSFSTCVVPGGQSAFTFSAPGVPIGGRPYFARQIVTCSGFIGELPTIAVPLQMSFNRPGNGAHSGSRVMVKVSQKRNLRLYNLDTIQRRRR